MTVFGLPPPTPPGWSRRSPQGEDAVAYGKRHGLSYDTVRYHLKTAFAPHRRAQPGAPAASRRARPDRILRRGEAHRQKGRPGGRP